MNESVKTLTTIGLEKSTVEWIKKYKLPGESYDVTLRRLLTFIDPDTKNMDLFLFAKVFRIVVRMTNDPERINLDDITPDESDDYFSTLDSPRYYEDGILFCYPVNVELLINTFVRLSLEAREMGVVTFLRKSKNQDE